MGNLTSSSNQFRHAHRFSWLENLIQDFRSAFRTLRHSPFFTATVIATLALGIGATSALFAVVDSALLRPIATFEPDRLVWLQEYSRTHEESGGTPLRFADWQHAHSLSSLCGLYSDSAVYTRDGDPVRLRILHTIGDPYKTLRPTLLIGRAFTASENQPVALLTASAWRRYFNADPNILHRTLRLGSAEYQVIGVLDSTDFPENIDLWAPATQDIAHSPRESGFLGEVGRLAPNTSLAQAQAEINLIGSHLESAYPATDQGRSATLVPLPEFVSKSARRPLLTLLAAAGTVLLIACVNIAGLLIARGLARQREAAIRISVGAGFLRLVRLFFAESLLLAALGCSLGLIVADLAIGILKTALPPDIPHLATVTLDWRVTASAFAIAGLSALLFGLLPAWQFAAVAQSPALKANRARVRSGLVVIEVALSLVLLITAALLMNSFFKMRAQPTGFNPANAYSFAVPFAWDTAPETLNTFASNAIARLTTSPGVVSAGVVDQLPLHGGSQSGRLLIQGADLDPVLADQQFSWRTATSGYFSAAGVPLKAGTIYRDWVGGKGERDALITDRLAALLFPNGDAVGHSIAEKNGSKAPHWFRIVGIVGSVRLNPSDSQSEAGVYVPWGATYWPQMNFVVKSTRSLVDFTRLVRNHVQPLTNAQIVENVDTLDALTAETRSSERIRTLLLASFAGAALLLSAIGLFGILSHEVARRTKDYGVRLALGAEPRSIAWLAIKSALLLATTGIAIGIGASVWTGQFLQGLLFGIEPSDPSAYFWSILLLLITAVVAALIPAAKAARIDPISALRHD